MIVHFLILSLLSGSASAMEKHGGKVLEPRTVFVQLFEWPWKDIARECEEYLGPNGFAAVQVSPPQEHLVLPDAPWWTRYQPISYRLDSRSGSEREFRDMVARCKHAGVDIYVDAVINHMSAMPEGVGSAGSRFKKYEYDGLYSYSDFHHCGRNGNDRIVDYRDRYELQNCELLGLSDLNTASPSVQNRIAGYLNKLLEFGVAGFRLDAVKHIASSDIRGILQRVRGDPYILQEIIPGEGQPTYSEYLDIGDVNVFEYAFGVSRAARDEWLGEFLGSFSQFPNSDSAVVFVENHDLQRLNREQYRLLSYRDDPELYFLAEAFMLTWPYGYPQLFSGYDFSSYDQGPPTTQDKSRVRTVLNYAGQCTSGWTCEHRAPGIAELVKFRNATDQQFTATNVAHNGRSQIVFGRGNLGFVAINFSDFPLIGSYATDLPPGQYCNILESRYRSRLDYRRCSNPYNVTKDRQITLNVPPRTAVVLQRAIAEP